MLGGPKCAPRRLRYTCTLRASLFWMRIPHYPSGTARRPCFAKCGAQNRCAQLAQRNQAIEYRVGTLAAADCTGDTRILRAGQRRPPAIICREGHHQPAQPRLIQEAGQGPTPFQGSQMSAQGPRVSFLQPFVPRCTLT